jgi:protein O-GlcNAc transferase
LAVRLVVSRSLILKKNRGFQVPPQRQVPNIIQQKLQQALALHRQGRLSDAKAIYEDILKQKQNHFDALHLLGMVAYQTRNLHQAEELIGKAIKVNPNDAAAYSNRGIVLADLKRLDEALASYDKAIALKPDYAEAYNNRGNALKNLKRLDEALASYDKAIALKPDYAEAYYNRGNALKDLKRLDEALASYEKAIALKPDYAEAYNNRGNALQDLKRLDEALASYDEAIALKPDYAEAYNNRGNALKDLKRLDEALASCDKAIALKPDYAEAYNNRGIALKDLNRLDEALASYDKATALKPGYAEAYNNRGIALKDLKRLDEALVSYDKAIALKPDYAEVYCNRGNVFCELKRYDEAFAAYDKALALKPHLEGARLGRGNVLCELKRYDEAFAAYDKALALKPDLEGAWLGRGNVLCELKRYDEAFAAYDKALALKPDLVSTEGARLHAKMHICDWINFDTECAHLISSVKNRKANTAPLAFLGISSSSDDQLQCSKLWIAEKCPPSQKPIWGGEHYRHDRIRVAYVSADFHQHATSSLMAGIFEGHDRSRFEITAISIGPDDNSEMRQRLKSSFEHFIDVTTLSDEEIALRIRETEIDILIDLKGFTQDARTNVFAPRPAPIQVNYLGYPGTMGASYIDYIIADQTVIPDDCKKFYSEKIVVLPNTYQVNDRKRVISDKAFTRSDVGLPSQGFVFCCFNNSYKITPCVFDRWMRILKQIEDSVLWLLEVNASAASNLKQEAAARGVSSERLVFAKRMPLPEHLARHKLADLFLDTLPYNAHTTASDALWAGLPVLTCLGETFAGRVAASLLNAIDLPELITTTLEAYEQMAIDLAKHPEKLTAIKRKLADNRLTTPLFDTKLFAKHIEAAYTTMYERHQAGLPPDHIAVPS